MLAAVLALGSSMAGGCADYIGGRLSRRYQPLLLVLLSQTVAVTAVGAAALLFRPFPGGGEWLFAAALAGAGAGLAIGCLYRALALGPMMLVAPVASTGALLPIVVGLAEGGPLRPPLALGMLVTLVGLVVATRAPGPQGAGPAHWRGGGLAFALLSAVGFGFFFLFLARASTASDPLWAVALSRGVLLCLLGTLVAIRPSGPRPSGSDFSSVVALGGLDACAALCFAAAASAGGEIGVTSLLASIAPLVTVLLARTHAGERLSRSQAVGAATTMAGALLVVAVSSQ